MTVRRSARSGGAKRGAPTESAPAPVAKKAKVSAKAPAKTTAAPGMPFFSSLLFVKCCL